MSSRLGWREVELGAELWWSRHWEFGAPGSEGWSSASAALFGFVAPLFEMARAPGNLEDLRRLVQLVEVCWNLPKVTADRHDHSDALGAAYSRLVAGLPKSVAAVVDRLFEDRRTTYAAVPFLVRIEVCGATLSQARLRFAVLPAPIAPTLS